MPVPPDNFRPQPDTNEHDPCDHGMAFFHDAFPEIDICLKPHGIGLIFKRQQAVIIMLPAASTPAPLKKAGTIIFRF